MPRNYDWPGFLETDPINGDQPPLSPSAFGKLLMAADDAGDALDLLGIAGQTIPSISGQSGKFLTNDGVGLSWAAGSGGGGAWGDITGTLSAQTDLQTALNAKVPTSRTVNGHALSGNISLSASDVGLGSVENSAASALYVPLARTVNGHALSGNISLTTGDLGATTIGAAMFSLANPGAITFPRFNADNSITARSAANFRSDIGAGTSSFDGAFSSLSGTPTTLSGYGITDAVKAGEVMLKSSQGSIVTYKAASNTDGARGTALTNAFAAHVAGDTISIGSGTYSVAVGVLDPQANVTIEGSGLVTLKAADHGAGAFTQLLSIIHGSGPRTDNVRIRNILFDCNLQNQSSTTAAIGAVSIYGGNNSVIEKCRAINWGSKKSGVECFIFYNQSTAGNGSGYANKILDCIVDTAAPVIHADGVTGFAISGVYTGTTPTTGWIFNSEIAGCIAHDITTGSSSGQPLYFNGMGTAGAYGFDFHDNQFYNILGTTGRPYFGDTGSVINNKIHDNIFLDVYDGIRLVTDNTTVTTSDWTISNNQIKAISNGIVIAPGGGTATRFVVRDNYISKSSGSPTGIYYSHISKLNILNNVFDDNIPSNTLTTAGTGTSTVTLFNNRVVSGGYIPGDVSPAGLTSNNIWTGFNSFQAGSLNVTNTLDAASFVIDLLEGTDADNSIRFGGINDDDIFKVKDGTLTLGTGQEGNTAVTIDLANINSGTSRLLHWPGGATGGTLALTENTGGEQQDGLYTAFLIKPSVALVASSNITLSGAQTIDGILGTVGQTLILCVAQTAGAQNGPWIMQTGAWTRPAWFDSGNTTKAKQFTTTFVRLGTNYSGSTWRMTTANVTIDTTAQTWVQTPLALGSTSVSGTLPVANGGTGITSLGTGVATALGVNVGSAGAFVTFNGAGGTPSSMTATNLSGTAASLNIGGSAGSLSISGQTGLLTFTGLASTNRIKTVRDAADTILELGGSYTPTGTWTSLTMVTPVLGTPTSGALTNCTSIPAGQLTGSIADARLSANVPLLNAANTFTAAQINSTAGAASTPALKLSGVPFAGTGTTSFPLLYINDANATASTTLATGGTYLGVNAHGTTDLLNLMLDGATKFKINSAGHVTIEGVTSTGATGTGKLVFDTSPVITGIGSGSTFASDFGALGTGTQLYDNNNGWRFKATASAAPTQGLRLSNNAGVYWTNSSDSNAAVNVGFSNPSTGLISLDSGTAGSYLDLQLRKIYGKQTAAGTVTTTYSLDVTVGRSWTLTTTASTNLSITPTAGGTADQEVTLIITSDATGGDVVTFASPFKPNGTMTLTASKVHTIRFISNGTNLYEVARVTAL